MDKRDKPTDSMLDWNQENELQNATVQESPMANPINKELSVIQDSISGHLVNVQNRLSSCMKVMKNSIHDEVVQRWYSNGLKSHW